MLHFLHSRLVFAECFPLPLTQDSAFLFPNTKRIMRGVLRVQAVAEVRVVGRGAAGLRSGEPSVPQGPDDQGLLV